MARPGNLYRQEFEHKLKDKGKYKVIVTTSITKYTDSLSLAQKIGDRTRGHWRVVVNRQSSLSSLGKVNIAEPETILSASVNTFIVKNESEAKKLKKHLEQPFVNEILKQVKYTVSNSTKFLQYIPAP